MSDILIPRHLFPLLIVLLYIPTSPLEEAHGLSLSLSRGSTSLAVHVPTLAGLHRSTKREEVMKKKCYDLEAAFQLLRDQSKKVVLQLYSMV